MEMRRVSSLPPKTGRHDMAFRQAEELVSAFKRDGWECAEIADHDGLFANGNNMRRTFQAVIDRYGIGDEIGVAIRGDDVYLFRKG